MKSAKFLNTFKIVISMLAVGLLLATFAFVSPINASAKTTVTEQYTAKLLIHEDFKDVGSISGNPNKKFSREYSVEGQVENTNLLTFVPTIKSEYVDKYMFAGWFFKGVRVRYGEELPRGNVELYAYFIEKSFIVEYYDGDVLVGEKNFLSTEKVSAIDVIKEDCSFDGWYTDEELTNKYVFGNVTTSDLKLYGKWIPSSHKANEEHKFDYDQDKAKELKGSSLAFFNNMTALGYVGLALAIVGVIGLGVAVFFIVKKKQ